MRRAIRAISVAIRFSVMCCCAMTKIKALNKLLMNTKQRKMQLVTQEKEMHVAAIAAFAKTEKANIVHQLFALMHGTHPKTKVKKKKKTSTR